MQKSILITGGYGFLGRAVARRFKSQGYYIAGLGTGRWDRSEYSSLGFDDWLDAAVSMASLSSLNKKFDVIAHCAGNGSVGYSISNPHQDFAKTVGSTAEVLEYMRLYNQGALMLYPSSAGVYGAKEDSPIKETDPLVPVSPYGYHKKVVEELCELYSSTYGLKIVIIRFFSLYGPGLTKQLLWDASLKLSVAKEEVIFWGTGGETRDWLNVDDATNLMLKAARSKEVFTIINGGAGNRVTVKEALILLKEELGVAGSISFNHAVRAGDPRFYHAEISKAKKLGWQPIVGLREGIRKYVTWYKGLRND